MLFLLLRPFLESKHPLAFLELQSPPDIPSLPLLMHQLHAIHQVPIAESIQVVVSSSLGHQDLTKFKTLLPMKHEPGHFRKSPCPNVPCTSLIIKHYSFAADVRFMKLIMLF